MTPEEAENFYEDDEDPQKIFDRFDAYRQIQWGLDYMRDHYGPGATPPAWPGRSTP